MRERAAVPKRLLFLHPKTLVDSWPTPVDLLGEFIKTPALIYPLLAAIVEDLPFDVEILDGYVARESFHAYKQRLARADIVAITVDRDGIVWVGTWGGGLSRFDGSKWQTYTTKEGLPGNHVSMLHVDKTGKLWIGTNNGVAQFEGSKFKTISMADGLFSNTVFSMATSPDNSVWIGSFGGVAHIKKPVSH